MQPVIKKTVIAISIALAISACQNLEQESKKDQAAKQQDNAGKTVKDMQPSLEELIDEMRRQEQVQIGKNKKLESEIQSQEKILRPVSEPPQQANLVTVTGSRIHNVDYEAKSMAITVQGFEQNRENYNKLEDNAVKLVDESPVSTFSIDVDTASYTNVRRMLNDGYLPPKEAVRLEEFVNYFDYKFPAANNLEQPFSISTSSMQAPWNQDAQLVQIGIKGYEPQEQSLPPSNLVFLIDVSGSMRSPDKLGLVKQSLKLLTKQLTPKDKVSLVVYAGASGVILEPTNGNNRLEIEQALDRLQAGGSTNGASGIELAYQMAKKGFIEEGINRVILATDGDFNVGMTNHDDLIELIEQKRKSNIFFSSLGFGTGNYNDHLMEQLANKGNGNAAYIDSLHEAKKVLVDERAGTLMTIAKDVKIQVEFNPAVVSEYRLLGYENRMLNREDFNNDKVDAGEIGAGHTVTALYEIVLTNSKVKRVDPLRYQNNNQDRIEKIGMNNRRALEAAMVKIRYKLPEANKSQLINKPIYANAFNQNSPDENIQFAASSAGFAQLLKGNKYLGDWNWQDAIDTARIAKGDDKQGYRAEMIKLMEMAKLLSDTSEIGAEINSDDSSDTSKLGLVSPND